MAEIVHYKLRTAFFCNILVSQHPALTMKTLLISALVLALANVSLQFKPPPYGAPRAAPEPVCRRVPSEVCEQVPRTKYETVARKQCQE